MNPWKILGVHRQMTEQEIQAAYYKLAWWAHPDRGGPAAKFAEINEAYAVLKDAKTRSEFITYMVAAHKECSACAGKGASYKSTGFAGRNFVACKPCGGSGVLMEDRQ